MASIVVLDDDPDILMLLERFLSERGHLPLTFKKTRHAELILDTLQPDLALLDINLPGEEHGISFGWRFRQSWPEVPIIIMSAELNSWDKTDIYDCGADEILEKPFNMSQMGCIIDKFLALGRSTGF